MVQPLAEAVQQKYREKYATEPDWLIQAPGRVNLIGDHTDTTGGWVLPAAVDAHMVIAAGLAPIDSELESLQTGPAVPRESWGRYPYGMRDLVSERLGFTVPPVRAVFSSDMPVGSGVSSSAALSVASGLMWLAAAARRLEPIEVAKLAQQVEWRYVGVRCGLMDPLASACGVAGCALLVDTSAETWVPVPIPEDIAIVLCHTGQDRALLNSAYNLRREQCESAEVAIGRKLRDASLDDIAGLPEPIRRRARHVITENARVRALASALDANDENQLGCLMAESHASLRDDFEVSTPALDAMVRAGQSAPGCVGIRLTGAGFGGACVALVTKSCTDSFVHATRLRYEEQSEYFPKFNVCPAVVGASISSGV